MTAQYTYVMKDLRKLAAEVNKEEAEKSSMAGKVYDSYSKFQTAIQPWHQISEASYYHLIAG